MPVSAPKRGHLAAATAAVANQFVTSTNMVNGAYTVANGGAMPGEGARQVTVTHTANTGNDTLGTITVAGTSLSGDAISEAITPTAGGTATGAKWFATVTSVTGAGWAASGGNDTVTVGCGARVVVAEGAGVLDRVVVGTTAAGAVTLKDSAGTIAVLKSSVAEGSYAFGCGFSGYLELVLAAASDVTAVFRQ
ncbi:MAG: hypothetical protein U0838_13050 [Chloroflexota bacterium]